MAFLNKILLMKKHIGQALLGFLFAAIAGTVIGKGASDGSWIPLLFLLLGLFLCIFNLQIIIQKLKKPAEAHSQYDHVPSQPPSEAAAELAFESSDLFAEIEEDFVFHYTDKTNQNHIMTDRNGAAVYEAATDRFLLPKARPYTFCNCMNGQEQNHSVTPPAAIPAACRASLKQMNIFSTFEIDGQDVWDLIASKGYCVTFTIDGFAERFEVSLWGQAAGSIEPAGRELIHSEYQSNLPGKMPNGGIFKVHCKKSDLPGFFLVCFALAHTV